MLMFDCKLLVEEDNCRLSDTAAVPPHKRKCSASHAGEGQSSTETATSKNMVSCLCRQPCLVLSPSAVLFYLLLLCPSFPSARLAEPAQIDSLLLSPSQVLKEAETLSGGYAGCVSLRAVGLSDT